MPIDASSPGHLTLPVSRYRARALYLGERLDLRDLRGLPARLALSPPVIEFVPQGWAALFRYGAVVLFNIDDDDEQRLIDTLRPRVRQPHEHPEHEEIQVVVDASRPEWIDGDTVILRESTMERLQALAEILAKSVVLAQYEVALNRVFDQVEPLAVELRSRRGARRARELLRHIGQVLQIQHALVGRVEVSEKPELLWERPELERIYLRLEEEYELLERHRALERKLQLVSETASTALELLQARRSLRVEWYIVILILVEIALTLFQMFTD